MKLKLFILSTFLFGVLTGRGQSILFQENFESGGGTFILNGAASVTTNTGTNMWTVNNNYTGGGGYPNTMSEDSTYGGTISFAPYSHYLHIYDVPSGYTDCNYNPANQSDRFAYTAAGACTFADTGVSVNFFYLCQGSPTAYGEVYYSAENGPWKQCGLLKYNSKYKWQYASITNPAFNNISNLRIGFHWVNNAGAGKDTSALAIDDFSIVGYSDIGAINITVSVSPDTICANSSSTVYLTYTTSDSLCAGGSYNINLYDSSNTWVAGWVTTSYSATVNGPYALLIPNSIKGTHCYTWVVDRTSAPAVTGKKSVCFYVENCPNSITTQQPVATMDSGKIVCAGSTIQIPFNSTGTYGNTSVYYAELSDSAGNFNPYDSLHNALFSSAAYPSTPGTVTVLIPDTVKAGCNYYVRVLSSIPKITGTKWGPFCIEHCDMNINTPGGGGGGGGNAGNGSPTTILACIHSCAKDPKGFIDTLNFSVNSYAKTVKYNPGNKFEVQLLSTSTFSVVNTGGFGVDTAANGKLVLHVPCGDSVCKMNSGLLLIPTMYGGYGGSFYMRIIATNSTPPDSNVSPVILLNIGYPNDSLTLSPSSPNEYCLGQTATLYADPFNFCTYDQFNPNTTYKWLLNSIQIFNGLVPGVGFTEPEGTYTVSVQEDNNGCYGPWDNFTFFVTGPPSVTMTGPTKACVGDTGLYSVPFTNNSLYKWGAKNLDIVDTANNVLKVYFDSVGTFTVSVNAYDSCGSSAKTRSVTVVARPKVTITGPTNLCKGTNVLLTAAGGKTYTWTPGAGLSCTACASPIATPTNTTTYTVAVSNGSCSVKDSVKVSVRPLPVDTSCCDQVILLGQNATISVMPGSANETYSWSPATGLNCTTCISPIATPTSTTTYTVTITDTTDHCIIIDSVTIYVQEKCGDVFVPDAFSPNGDGQNDVLYVKGVCIKSMDFIIYDRWGNKVFETQDPKVGWDGKYNGQPMNTGTFVYYLQALTNDNKLTTKKGNITLVR
jgi:gliding motility-associated-like protein